MTESSLSQDENPTPCNHGGSTRNSAPSNLPAVTIHWARLVLPADPDSWTRLDQLLGARKPTGRVLWGWYDRTAQILDGKGLIGWCTNPDRAQVEGLVVELPGQACAALGTRLDEVLVNLLVTGHATRVDFAIDDDQGNLTKARILDAEASDHLVTRWRGRQLRDGTRERLKVIEGKRLGQSTGWCVYFGRPQSRSRLRIYDKAAQDNQPGPLVRLELQTNGDLADQLLRAALNAGARVVRAEISARLRFVDLPTSGRDRDKRRWTVSPWWRAIVGRPSPGDRVQPPVKEREPDVARLREWVYNTAGPTLATIVAVDGGDLTWLEWVITNNWPRVRAEYLALIPIVAQRAEEISAKGAP